MEFVGPGAKLRDLVRMRLHVEVLIRLTKLAQDDDEIVLVGMGIPYWLIRHGLP
jgi:hypothetical protein